MGAHFKVNDHPVYANQFTRFRRQMEQVLRQDLSRQAQDKSFSPREIRGMLDLDGDGNLSFKDLRHDLTLPIARPSVFNKIEELLYTYGFKVWDELASGPEDVPPANFWIDREFTEDWLTLADYVPSLNQELSFFKRDRDIVLRVLSRRGMELEYAPDFQGDIWAVKTAYYQNPESFQFVHEDLKKAAKDNQASDPESAKLRKSLSWFFYPSLSVGGGFHLNEGAFMAGGRLDGGYGDWGLFFDFKNLTIQKTTEENSGATEVRSQHTQIGTAGPIYNFGLSDRGDHRSDVGFYQVGIPLGLSRTQGQGEFIGGLEMRAWSGLHTWLGAGLRGSLMLTPFAEFKNVTALLALDLSPAPWFQ